MNFYLIKQEQVFFDPHGEHDEGETLYFVVEGNSQIEWYNPSVYYKEAFKNLSNEPFENKAMWDGEELAQDTELSFWDDHDLYASDGYNFWAWSIKWTKLEATEAKKVTQLLQNYDNLKSLFK